VRRLDRAEVSAASSGSAAAALKEPGRSV